MRVQQSFPRPRPTTNPYLIQLAESIRALPDAELRTFSWRRALLGRFDVFHVHWPEILVGGQSPVKALVRQALTILLVAKLAATRTPLVRTLHNLERPTGLSALQHAILDLVDRRTTLWIRLNDETPETPARPSVLIRHGHYRDWYTSLELPERQANRVAFVGRIRRYKGVEALISAFRRVGGDFTLQVAGRPSNDELERSLRDLARGDSRITLEPRFLDDDDLVRTVRSAALIVLPYREMHNSGGVLTALSLDRPVLVPANDVNARLASEVGSPWVQQFSGELGPDDIVSALGRVAQLTDDDRPDLSGRDWDDAGAAHLDAYRLARRLLRAPSERVVDRLGAPA